MHMNAIRNLSTIALAMVSLILTLPVSGSDAVSTSPLRETKEKEAPLAVEGLDVTTYFDEGGPVEGTPSITVEWNDKVWRFVSEADRAGDLQRARYLFEKMLGYANDLGLFSEQLGPKGEFLGNVPQAFTHLAMISAAYDLDRRLDQHPSRGVSGGMG